MEKEKIKSREDYISFIDDEDVLSINSLMQELENNRKQTQTEEPIFDIKINSVKRVNV